MLRTKSWRDKLALVVFVLLMVFCAFCYEVASSGAPEPYPTILIPPSIMTATPEAAQYVYLPHVASGQ
jgi:integral membrane sensor domain MASE1